MANSKGRPTKEQINARKQNQKSSGATNPNFNNEELNVIDNDNIETDLSLDENIIDPLVTEPVVDMEYTKLDAQIIGIIPDSVPEEIIEKPIIDFNEHPESNDLNSPLDSKINNDAQPEPESKQKEDAGQVRNPGWDDLTGKQKNASAEYLAETCINAYVMLNELGKKWCTFDEAKMQSQALDGKFDFSILKLSINLSEDGNENITIGEFFDSVNHQAEEIFVVSQEFKDQVKPILMEIFKKKGWGLTPEQRLIALVIEDGTPKVMLAFSIRSQFKQLIKMGMAMLNNQKVEQQQRYDAAQEQANIENQKKVEKEQEVIIPEEVIEKNNMEDFKEPA
jgi:hypothetical protein